VHKVGNQYIASTTFLAQEGRHVLTPKRSA